MPTKTNEWTISFFIWSSCQFLSLSEKKRNEFSLVMVPTEANFGFDHEHFFFLLYVKKNNFFVSTQPKQSCENRQQSTSFTWPFLAIQLHFVSCWSWPITRSCQARFVGWKEKQVKGEVRRKMNFTYVLGFVVLRDVVKVFPVSSFSFARKTTGRNRAQSHSGAWRSLKTKWDLKLSLPSPTYLIRARKIGRHPAICD